MRRLAAAGLVLAIAAWSAEAQQSPATKPRARELGISALIGGTPGTLDAITDVAGVEVGHATIIRGAPGPIVVGTGPVRTGVTIVHPRGQRSNDPVFGAWFTLNGNGEMTGTTWLEEGGILEGPIGITNTNSVGVVRDGILQWQVGSPGLQPWGLPVAAETWDGSLNDINGFHVKPEHVREAITTARGGPVLEGAVGGGTGMICLGFKGGIGTASRKLPAALGGYTVGVLAQCNFGNQRNLMIGGVPVGQELTDLAMCRTADLPATTEPDARGLRRCAPGATRDDSVEPRELGSIIVVVATDAPLMPHQLKRIATRVSLGVGRVGGFASNGSGDIFIAFSTANPSTAMASDSTKLTMLSNGIISPLFTATVQATEEAIINAMLAAETMEGANYARVYGLPADRVLSAIKKYGR
jgi:L-aminopeptidase/D-esterase-like protein